MRKYKVTLGISVILSLIASLTLILTPYYLGEGIDLMVGQGLVDFGGIRKYLLIVVVMYLISFVATWCVSLLANRVSIKFVEDLRKKLKNHVTKLPISYLDTHAHGNIESMFAMDTELVLDGMFQGITQLLGGIFTIAISTIFMLSINIMMTVIVIGLVPLMFITSRLVSKYSVAQFRKQQDLAGQLSSHASESFNNNRLVMSYNYQSQSIETFEKINDELNDVGEKAQFISAITNPTTRVVNNISYLLLGLSGAFAVHNFGLSIGLFTSFISYSMMFSKPFNEFSAVVAQVMAAKASYERIQSLLSEPIEEETKETVSLEGKTVAFNDVGFAYNPKNPLIENMNLHIAPLSKVAIVGPTGAGKSTMINLLMRFYDVRSGEILIDGVDINTISKASVRDTMGIVLQDPWLFEGTIRDNIAYGKPDASLAMIEEAARQAGCHDMIMRMDNGYDTIIELGSKNISLGQRQMITIARALIVDAPIIILDEATSSLDVITEQKIQQVFTEIMAKRTSFFVAHRLSTVVDSDVILVMKDGHLIEQGNHDALMKKGGFYHELYMSQF